MHKEFVTLIAQGGGGGVGIARPVKHKGGN